MIAMLSVVITEPGWCRGESTQPPTNVAWIQILMWTLYMYVGWGALICPFPQKPHFQIPIRPGISKTMSHQVEVLPLNH